MKMWVIAFSTLCVNIIPLAADRAKERSQTNANKIRNLVAYVSDVSLAPRGDIHSDQTCDTLVQKVVTQTKGLNDQSIEKILKEIVQELLQCLTVNNDVETNRNAYGTGNGVPISPFVRVGRADLRIPTGWRGGKKKRNVGKEERAKDPKGLKNYITALDQQQSNKEGVLGKENRPHPAGWRAGKREQEDERPAGWRAGKREHEDERPAGWRAGDQENERPAGWRAGRRDHIQNQAEVYSNGVNDEENEENSVIWRENDLDQGKQHKEEEKKFSHGGHIPAGWRSGDMICKQTQESNVHDEIESTKQDEKPRFSGWRGGRKRHISIEADPRSSKPRKKFPRIGGDAFSSQDEK